MNKVKESTLAIQQQALTQYLDSLLMEIPDQEGCEVIPQVLAVASAETDEIPEWARSPFKVLYFSVGEMQLAAPLDKCGSVITDYGDITALPGTSSYYLGVILHGGHTVRVIDFHRFVANVSGENVSKSISYATPPNRIILIEGRNIGIACRNVAETDEIAPEEIRWRRGLNKHSWYRGIVVKKMCALLDIDVMWSIVNNDVGHL